MLLYSGFYKVFNVWKIVAESTAVPSGLGMNHPAQRFRKESVTVERAIRNTYMHAQVGVTRWARQDSNLTSENTSNDTAF